MENSKIFHPALVIVLLFLGQPAVSANSRQIFAFPGSKTVFSSRGRLPEAGEVRVYMADKPSEVVKKYFAKRISEQSGKLIEFPGIANGNFLLAAEQDKKWCLISIQQHNKNTFIIVVEYGGDALHEK